MARGFQLTALFTPVRERPERGNRLVRALAERCGAPVIIGRLTSAQLRELLDGGVTAVFSAAYPFRIPLTAEIPYGFNLHPSALPEGRGPSPLAYPILRNNRETAVTLHQLAGEYDAGDIILQKKIELSASDTADTLTAKARIAAVQLMHEFSEAPEAYWSSKRPQRGGSYCPMHPIEERTIRWDTHVSDIDRLARAFGRAGVFAEFKGERWRVRSLHTWVDPAPLPAGTVMLRRPTEVTVAAKDGYVYLTELERLG